jgi:[acyl-carrier-protein] S-malonyltransferase
MGKKLAAAFEESRRVFDEADLALGVRLSETCFAGSEEELSRTETTQPAVLTVSVAALRALETRGVRPNAVAGHSLGEYTAHVAAGTISFPDAVRSVRLRGRFMQEAVPEGEGAMAAILGPDLETIERICKEHAGSEVVSVANINAPGQIVIAGHSAAVSRAIEAALAAGARRALRLPVSAPFHCSLMAPAAERLLGVLAAVPFRTPHVPVYTNVDATAVGDAEAARRALIRQVTAPVRWIEVVQAMAAAGIRTFLEVGPGKVLAGLVKRILEDARVLSVSEPEHVEAAAQQVGRPA